MAQLGRTAMQGAAVTGLSQAIRMAISFLSVVVLARLLLPSDFGLFASVWPVVAFVSMFQDLGLQQAIIQREVVEPHHLNQTFWVSVMVGCAATGVILFSSPFVAAFYGDARIRNLMLLAALPVLFSSISSVPVALLNRRLRFGWLALNDVLNAIVGLTSTAAAALLGFGYWSLVVGPAAAALASMILCWFAEPYRPGKIDLGLDRDMLHFGANLTGFNVLNFFARNADNVLVGRYLGFTSLGYYDRAYKLLLFPIQNISSPLARLMIPILSRIQTDKARLRRIYLRTNWMLGLVMMPGIATVTIGAPSIISTLFGERWAPVAPIFAWLGVIGFSEVVLTTTGWLFISQGKTREMFRLGIYSSTVTILSFVIGLHWGTIGVAAAYAISAYVLRIPVLAYVLHRIGPVSAIDIMSIVGVYGAAALIAAAIHSTLPIVGHFPSYPEIASIVYAACLAYGLAALFAFSYPPARSMLTETIYQIRTTLRPAST